MPTDDCNYGDIRLVGGESEAEGRLEICSGHRWGTVCDNEWTEQEWLVETWDSVMLLEVDTQCNVGGHS